MNDTNNFNTTVLLNINTVLFVYEKRCLPATLLIGALLLLGQDLSWGMLCLYGHSIDLLRRASLDSYAEVYDNCAYMRL